MTILCIAAETFVSCNILIRVFERKQNVLLLTMCIIFCNRDKADSFDSEHHCYSLGEFKLLLFVTK